LSETGGLIQLACLLLLGLVAEAVGRRTRLPRVSLLILAGVLVGPVGLDWLDAQAEQWFPRVSEIALAMIGFLLGGRLTKELWVNSGRHVLVLSLIFLLTTIAVVGLGLYVAGLPISLALLMAAIATATDPAATEDVINQYKAQGKFTDILRGIVAIDDLWGIVSFTVILVVVHSLQGAGNGSGVLLHGAWELFGSVGLGVLLGVPMAYLTGRIRENQPTLVEALATVLLCAGLAIWLELSYLLACITMGVVVVNAAGHHERPFHAIEDIEWPFLILFFILAGSRLDFSVLVGLEWLLVAYCVLRLLGRVLGGMLSPCFHAFLGGKQQAENYRFMGVAMLPQAGVAMAMAFMASQTFPEYADQLLAVVLVSTVLFELFGPLATHQVLRRHADLGK
jgi:NhaP-type Na+/H+ or K+/H+ antiporter